VNRRASKWGRVWPAGAAGEEGSEKREERIDKRGGLRPKDGTHIIGAVLPCHIGSWLLVCIVWDQDGPLK